VQSVVPWLYRWPSLDMHMEFPQALLGTLPAMIAWIGLWWSNHPADNSLREQSVLVNLNDDLPVHAPPTFRETLSANFRLQVMFTLVPVVFILILRDLAAVGFGLAGISDAKGVENLVMVPATGLVFVLAPELLRRVLHTERLPDSPLRRRLERMCRDAGLKYREILLWRTDSTMGNAAVMGMFPRVRYVLLSDLLLETMTDRQIEAVFAHELGHVVHKHLMWFGLYAICAMCFMAGPGDQLVSLLQRWFEGRYGRGAWETVEGLIATVIGFGSFVLALGFLSPKFERQADVFAARTMQRAEERSGVGGQRSEQATEGAMGVLMPVPYAEGPSYVGEYGAGVFASALHRVAVINHIPVTARNWSHGSIAQRMRALHEMSADPAHTGRFDRFMTRLYAGLIVCLCTCGVWAAVLGVRSGDGQVPAGRGGNAPMMGGAAPTAVRAGR
jgi:Zn-dependent protease with chaperone function